MKVIYDGAEHEIGEPDNLDMVRFERHFKTSATALGNDQRIEHMLFVLHSRLVRLGVTAEKWSDEELVKIQIVSEDEVTSVDPTADQVKPLAA